MKVIDTTWLNDLSTFELDKLKNDPFYWSMVEHGYNYKNLQKSGWLNTGYSKEDYAFNHQLFLSPIENHLPKDRNKEIFILLNTGSYAPVHDGHFEMMLMAKNKLEKEGHDINALIMSPSHDNYVLTKPVYIEPWHIHQRLFSLKEKIENYNKEYQNIFMIDVWEALYCQFAVNFTDVISHLVNHIKKLGYSNFKIGYVFGSDNQAFIDCFAYLAEDLKQHFYAICVERNGHEFKNEHLVSSSNILYANMMLHGDKQSRIIRNNYLNDKKNFDKEDCIYAVRYDEELALSQWLIKYPQYKQQLIDSFKIFHHGLCLAIKDNINLPIISIDAEEQLSYVKEFSKTQKTLNLDIYTNRIDYNSSLNLCRYFGIGDYQSQPIEMIIRPEYDTQLSVEEYLSQYSAGDYHFVDDDIFTGKTLSFIKELLKPVDINISKEHSLLDIYFEKNHISSSLYDIVDTRDFLLGAFSGGLTCLLKENYIRVPYIQPWVNLQKRAKLDPFKLKKFNTTILQLNKDFFEKNSFISFNDFDTHIKKFLLSQYHTSTITKWCENHQLWINKNMI